MKNLIKNPMSIWFLKFILSRGTEFINRKKKLKIGYLSYVKNCQFGIYNTLYDNVNLDSVTLGDFTYIAGNTGISKTIIGKFCSIGGNCRIGLGKHPTDTFVSTHPIFFSILNQAQISFADKNYFVESEDINIGNDVWIGTNVLIIDGVSIGDGVIVAAGSVVTKDIPPYAIAGGIPAKIIRYRFTKEEIEQLLALQWWNKDFSVIRKNFKDFHDINMLLKANAK